MRSLDDEGHRQEQYEKINKGFSAGGTEEPRIGIENKFSSEIVLLFREAENSFMRYFDFYFKKNKDINHCTTENRILILNITLNIAENCEIVDIFLFEIIVAVLYAFYALVLLELLGDNISIEEICNFIRLKPDEIDKIKEIFYGIIWGDDPALANARRQILFGHQSSISLSPAPSVPT